MTERQRRFCDEYLIDLNATQAALRAGYAESTAADAPKWINENPENPRFVPEMAAYIRERMAGKTDELIASQDEVLRFLTSVMRRQKEEHSVEVVGEYEEMTEAGFDGDLRTRLVRQEKAVVVPFETKVSDALRAAELLGKRYGIFTENIVTEVRMPTIIDDIGDE